MYCDLLRLINLYSLDPILSIEILHICRRFLGIDAFIIEQIWDTCYETEEVRVFDCPIQSKGPFFFNKAVRAGWPELMLAVRETAPEEIVADVLFSIASHCVPTGMQTMCQGFCRSSDDSFDPTLRLNAEVAGGRRPNTVSYCRRYSLEDS